MTPKLILCRESLTRLDDQAQRNTPGGTSLLPTTSKSPMACATTPKFSMVGCPYTATAC